MKMLSHILYVESYKEGDQVIKRGGRMKKVTATVIMAMALTALTACGSGDSHEDHKNHENHEQHEKN
ncbi:hypothetical protein ACQCVB_09465 [Fictibacillus phosphorivorans]|uniref:hypothetical protein n=1 Tax=Fictibacillus phosphorivorans TaxID=1221500 RepID=UPI003CF8B264